MAQSCGESDAHDVTSRPKLAPALGKGVAHSNVIVPFADSMKDYQIVRAGRIFEDLMHANLWFMQQRLKALQIGSTVLFYQSQVGLRGYAIVTAIGETTPQDLGRLNQYGLGHLTVRISLESIVIFPSALSIRPLVQELAFIKNKQYWGHNVRIPTMISDNDVALLLKSAAHSDEVNNPAANGPKKAKRGT